LRQTAFWPESRDTVPVEALSTTFGERALPVGPDGEEAAPIVKMSW
jgi:hypothetical protein